MKYPKEIYVQIQGADDDKYFEAKKSAEGLDDGNVAIYVLKEMKTKKTNITLI